MLKKTKTNSIRRNFRVAQKKAVIKRGFDGRLSEAYLWLKISMLVYDNFDIFKSLVEQLFK
jgi:hypothetical protein